MMCGKNAETSKKAFIAICMVVVSIGILLLAFQIPDSQRAEMSGARLLPVIVAALLVVLSLLQGIAVLTGHDGQQGQTDRISYQRWIVVIGLLVAYACVLESIGFVLATFFLVLLLASLFGMTGMRVMLVFSGTLTITVWLLFTKLFGNYLPKGFYF